LLLKHIFHPLHIVIAGFSLQDFQDFLHSGVTHVLGCLCGIAHDLLQNGEEAGVTEHFFRFWVVH
jgi:hypothetical protein